ncbi:hypothetical protein HanRHA438_Chr01g0009301 [Helianthus annuus]|uniref:Uncharacterized protein n=1 Tax=Helianthus annuus TaxID=4232 RepID=A0A251VM32_HELAN|nr:hypothetical protein HanXRQr2_Chr01g0009041 [Helianthus annuus]KAJ0610759.1 hypothetical protein HanHA300_Chr01g0007411 [Helianthus annuus]KAJ0621557.1 hypothetical protein HanIR_Chr01g0010021 [Helianthus annuus]KAJ0808831.1 hypothetical protein HanPI659440_Chr01g0007701 [Helianthus annuus]KAJ0946917.1 hypothetical protein HanRHA438_Chr01g0009301 [Helianthus annuus]
MSPEKHNPGGSLLIRSSFQQSISTSGKSDSCTISSSPSHAVPSLTLGLNHQQRRHTDDVLTGAPELRLLEYPPIQSSPHNRQNQRLWRN